MADINTTISPNLPKGKVGATETSSPKSLKKKVPEPEETVTSNGLDDAQSQVETGGEQEDGQTEKADEVAASGEEGEEVEEAVPVGSVDAEGNVVDGEGNTVGKVNGDAPEGSMVDTEGDVLDAEGNVIGKAKLVEHAAKDMEEGAGEAAGGADPVKNAAKNVEEGAAEAAEGAEGAELVEHAAKDVEGAAGATAEEAENPEPAGPFGVQGNGEATNEGDLSDKGLNEKGLKDVELEAQLDLSILKGKKVNKLGKIVDEEGTPVGQLVEGDSKRLAGKIVDAEGKIWNNAGKVIGRAEPLPDTEHEAALSAPFEDFPDSVVDAKGNVMFEGRIVGKLVEGDPKKLEGKKVDEDGDILDKHGNILGKAERFQEDKPLPEEPKLTDLSILEGKKVNKAGNVVDENGKLFGRVVDGEVSKLVGRKCDAEGKIWSSSGKVIGTAELVPVDDRDEDSSAPFEDFPDAVVDSKGNILFEGQVVGKLIEGDAKKLAGKKIDEDGEVVDKIGNVLGKAERWMEPDVPEPEAVDMSALAGKRVNKLGNLVDPSGQIFGRLVQGDPRKLVGKMCDKNGNVMDEMGQVVGKAELVPESEREGEKTGPFVNFDNPTITKDGKVIDAKGSIIGRLIEGDAKELFGKPVDPDGDILDKNGNTLGKAERWEEEEKEISKHPAAGRKVNRQGDVVDENGDVIAKLTEGEVTKCAGKEIDNDGDVVDSKGKVVGHVTLLEDISAIVEPEALVEPEELKETEEEIEHRRQLQQDNKLAGQLASCIEQTIDKIKPILKLITDAIDAAERQPKDELDEQKLVDTVKPLLEEGGQILQECNGAIRALDPDGRIQTNAKHKTASREATPEEYRLAEQLKELTGSVIQTIDQAKKKIAGMPHVKKELNPLWGLLAEPLGQIIAAVGLLLSGVLGLVGRLLNILGLGGLLDNLLGGLGLKAILEGLGLGTLTKSLTGKR